MRGNLALWADAITRLSANQGFFDLVICANPPHGSVGIVQVFSTKLIALSNGNPAHGSVRIVQIFSNRSFHLRLRARSAPEVKKSFRCRKDLKYPQTAVWGIS